MTTRIVSCYFGAGHEDQWPRLARVLKYSAGQHCPTWQTQIVELTPDADLLKRARMESEAHNTQKLKYWAQAVIDAEDGDRMLLIDSDTAILRPLDAIWDQPFDVAYTVRPQPAMFPFNAGVIFLRVSPRVKVFMGRWEAENDRMFGDVVHHHEWRRRFAGINQAAFGAILASDIAASIEILELTCPEWNCEDASWEQFDPDVTRILHLKSMLRRSVFNLSPTPVWLRPLAERWRRIETLVPR